MWLIFAILSAVFAAATAVLAKIGIEGVESNLATAIRTVVVVVMARVVVFVSHRIGHPIINIIHSASPQAVSHNCQPHGTSHPSLTFH